jgi:uncharacterized protein
MNATAASERVFLSAEWRDLVMLNYQVEPGLLQSYIPRGTELDSFGGRTFVSLVGFRFLRTRLFGRIRIPFHTNFDEVNLRFYVRRRENGEERRGVVFIREIVPRAAIALVARVAYGEKYIACPMRHAVSPPESPGEYRYEWRHGGTWCSINARVSGAAAQPQEGSLEQFITEHYWGYSTQPGGRALEYHVSHVPWRVWHSDAAGFQGDADALYGPQLGAVVRLPPDSAFVADGSPVLVFASRPVQRPKP